MESAHFKLEDDDYLVNVHSYTAKPSLSHGDLVFDPRSDLSQGRGDDVEHPTDITMSRVRLASDTFNIHFTYTKVNHLLYACSLDPFQDGILLDTPLVCMHRYCRNATDDEEECERKCTTTPSAREAWKRRRKKELQCLQRPDDRKTPDVRPSTAAGRPTNTGRPTSPRHRTSDAHRKSGATHTEAKRRTSDALQMTGPP